MLKSHNPTVDKQILGLFTDRWAIGCAIILFFQQVIEASSTIWLVKLMQTITKGENFTIYFVLYLSSLALAYLPQCIAFIVKITWKQEAQRTFINTFIANNKDNIAEWSNKGIREQKLSILTAEGPTAIHAVIDYAWDLYTYVLSVFLNMATLAIILEPMFMVTYGVSIICVIIVMKLKRRAQRQLTQKALSARIDLSQSLLAAWDNVLLGNEYNFNLWEQRTMQRLNRCMQKNVALERFDQILAIVVSLITSIPSLMVVVYYVVTHRDNLVELSSFIVILPILFLILSYTYQTLSLVFRWSMHRGKLISIYKSIQGDSGKNGSMEKKIKWAKISLFEQKSSSSTDAPSLPGPQPIRSCHDLLQKASTSCRLTIRGDNGCGKSTTLMLVKKALEHRAFFLPTHNQLSFLTQANKYSTGESLRNRLQEIIREVRNVDVLLLDEWDANLDCDNYERLSALIDELAETKCVIEVRHR